MATFNSMPTMTSGGPQTNEGMMMGHAPGHHNMGMESFEPELNFDEALLDNGALPPLSFTPSYDFEHFATTFEDPFSYSTKPYEPAPAAHSHQDALHEEASPQELDNKLLGFSDTIVNASVTDDTGKFSETSLSAELYGMFFVAEDVFGGESSGRPLELTCYRRNLWQCSGQIILPRSVSCVVDERGRQVPITELTASITAVESIEGKPTEIISIPWKSSNPQVTEEAKVPSAPHHISLDLSAAQELDGSRVCLSISWKRLQFKHATANNGRRKGLQQHYVVQINLLGKTKLGDVVDIAEIHSSPVIVRGRSPRNFDSRKDVPLTGDTTKRFERKNTASSDSSVAKVERDNLQAQMQRFPAINANGQQQGQEWAMPNPQAVPNQSQSQSPHPAKRLAISPTISRPPIPGWSRESAPAAKGPSPPRVPMSRHGPSASAPINLSLSEDERSPNRSSADVQSPQLAKTNFTSNQNAAASPSEEADPLYEYFPLSVDDWMPPVDAVYRPHVVHHTIVPPEFKAQQSKSKAKRYFAAE